MSAGPAPSSLQASRSSSLLTFAWGLYLACSWTWCIGMYLPKLLLDRFGWPGFIAFAIPNVLGCVAFGYIVRNRERSEAMVARHRHAMGAFALVTIAYQAVFLGLLIQWLAGPDLNISSRHGWLIAAGTTILAGMTLAAAWLHDRAWLALAGLTYLISLIACTWVTATSPAQHGWSGTAPPSDLPWLALPMIIGFLACPYLDLTFHRAVAHAPSLHAFAIFGVMFFMMILFTCFIWPTDVRALAPLAVAHVVAQLVFTCGVHLRELRVRGLWRQWMRHPAGWAALIVATLLMFSGLQMAHSIQDGNELYLRWLGFYGLVFPTYVILFIAPARPLAASRRTLAIFGLLVLALAPLYELAFIRSVTWVMMFPVVATIAWLIARRNRATP